MRAAELDDLLAPLRSLKAPTDRELPGVTALLDRHRRMARRDLAHRPYRWWLLRLPNSDQVAPAAEHGVPLHPALIRGADLLVAALREQRSDRRDLRLAGSANAGLIFATRPPSMMELHQALPSTDPGQYGVQRGTVIRTILHALRGYFGPVVPEVRERPDWPTVISVPVRRGPGPIRVALAMLGTDLTDAIAAAKGKPILTGPRLHRLQKLLDTVAKHSPRPEYVVLPELAMPTGALHRPSPGSSTLRHQPNSRRRASTDRPEASHESGSRSSAPRRLRTHVLSLLSGQATTRRARSKVDPRSRRSAPDPSGAVAAAASGRTRRLPFRHAHLQRTYEHCVPRPPPRSH